jgi:sodium/bile acid cotransporter 7
MSTKNTETNAFIPQTTDDILKVAAGLGLHFPDECLPGVTANLALLARHAARLRDIRK